MSTQPLAASRPWHRYLRFSVRGLMVVVPDGERYVAGSLGDYFASFMT
jgi:hypothetical protein